DYEYNADLMFRLDDGSIPHKATFEATFMNIDHRTFPKELVDNVLNVDVVSGKKVEFVLKNFFDTIEDSQSIGFKYNSLADVYKQLPGRVYFSEKYPKAYIDKMEFKPGGWDTPSVLCY